MLGSALVVPGSVHAEDIATTIVLDSIPTSVLPLVDGTYTAHVTPIPPAGLGHVVFQVSSDGVTWADFLHENTDAAGYASGQQSVQPDVPKGTRHVRAYFFPMTGFSESYSD